MMNGDRVNVNGNRMYSLKTVVDSSIRGTQTDIGALATKASKSAAVMVWNYHDNDLQVPAKPVNVTIKGIPAKMVTTKIYLIDSENSNSYEVWKKMGFLYR